MLRFRIHENNNDGTTWILNLKILTKGNETFKLKLYKCFFRFCCEIVRVGIVKKTFTIYDLCVV